VAPLAFFAEAYPGSGAAILGFRSCEEGRVAERLVAAGCQVATTTDLITERMLANAGRTDRILTCGPWEMMKSVAAFSRRTGVPCESALEREFGCGIGACLGCVVETTDPDRPYARVCTEGPVMDAEKVKWST
jgi:dihydroorotate dehydrogenase electron transfer subunit